MPAPYGPAGRFSPPRPSGRKEQGVPALHRRSRFRSCRVPDSDSDGDHGGKHSRGDDELRRTHGGTRPARTHAWYLSPDHTRRGRRRRQDQTRGPRRPAGRTRPSRRSLVGGSLPAPGRRAARRDRVRRRRALRSHPAHAHRRPVRMAHRQTAVAHPRLLRTSAPLLRPSARGDPHHFARPHRARHQQTAPRHQGRATHRGGTAAGRRRGRRTHPVPGPGPCRGPRRHLRRARGRRGRR